KNRNSCINRTMRYRKEYTQSLTMWIASVVHGTPLYDYQTKSLISLDKMDVTPVNDTSDAKCEE
ncbi:hypothetical protein PV326_012590, partial [Microctonus aethiopoides]